MVPYAGFVAASCLSTGVPRLQHVHSDMVGRPALLPHQCLHSGLLLGQPDSGPSIPAGTNALHRKDHLKIELEHCTPTLTST